MSNNDLMSTLMGVLSNPEAKDKLSGIISSIGSNNSGNSSVPAQQMQNQSNIEMPDFNFPQQNLPIQSNPSENNMDMVVKIKSMLDNFNNTDDTRIGLLNSIKPYLRSGRGKNVDMAIKFIQLINFTSGFKNG